jgi:hypothetical protein
VKEEDVKKMSGRLIALALFLVAAACASSGGGTSVGVGLGVDTYSPSWGGGPWGEGYYGTEAGSDFPGNPAPIPVDTAAMPN